MILIFVLNLLLSFCYSSCFNSTLSGYLDVILLDYYQESLYYDKNELAINEEMFCQNVNQELDCYFASFDTIKNIRIKYYFEMVKVVISISYAHYCFNYEIVKELGYYEK